MSLRTPDRLTERIFEGCRKINKVKLPYYVQVRVEPDCLPLRCFNNVMDKVEKDGGLIQFGWKILEQPKEAVVARFHTIWISPEGVPIDITPDPVVKEKILFSPTEPGWFGKSPISVTADRRHLAIIAYILAKNLKM